MNKEMQPATINEAFVNDFLQRLRTIFNSHDLDGLISLMREDVVFEHPWAGTLHGHAQVRDFYARFWSAFPDLAVKPANGPFFHMHAPRITIIWLGTGTQTQLLEPPGLPPTGKRIEGYIWEMMEFRDGLLNRINQAFDTAGFMRQLGLLPEQGSPVQSEQ